MFRKASGPTVRDLLRPRRRHSDMVSHAPAMVTPPNNAQPTAIFLNRGVVTARPRRLRDGKSSSTSSMQPFPLAGEGGESDPPSNSPKSFLAGEQAEHPSPAHEVHVARGSRWSPAPSDGARLFAEALRCVLHDPGVLLKPRIAAPLASSSASSSASMVARSYLRADLASHPPSPPAAAAAESWERVGGGVVAMVPSESGAAEVVPRTHARTHKQLRMRLSENGESQLRIAREGEIAGDASDQFPRPEKEERDYGS